MANFTSFTNNFRDTGVQSQRRGKQDQHPSITSTSTQNRGQANNTPFINTLQETRNRLNKIGENSPSGVSGGVNNQRPLGASVFDRNAFNGRMEPPVISRNQPNNQPNNQSNNQSNNQGVNQNPRQANEDMNLGKLENAAHSIRNYGGLGRFYEAWKPYIEGRGGTVTLGTDNLAAQALGRLLNQGYSLQDIDNALSAGVNGQRPPSRIQPEPRPPEPTPIPRDDRPPGDEKVPPRLPSDPRDDRPPRGDRSPEDERFPPILPSPNPRDERIPPRLRDIRGKSYSAPVDEAPPRIPGFPRVPRERWDDPRRRLIEMINAGKLGHRLY